MESTLQYAPLAVEPSGTQAFMRPLSAFFFGMATSIAVGVTMTRKWLNGSLQNSENLLGVGGQTMRPSMTTQLNVAESAAELGMLQRRAGVPTMQSKASFSRAFRT